MNEQFEVGESVAVTRGQSRCVIGIGTVSRLTKTLVIVRPELGLPRCEKKFSREYGSEWPRLGFGGCHIRKANTEDRVLIEEEERRYAENEAAAKAEHTCERCGTVYVGPYHDADYCNRMKLERSHTDLLAALEAILERDVQVELGRRYHTGFGDEPIMGCPWCNAEANWEGALVHKDMCATATCRAAIAKAKGAKE